MIGYFVGSISGANACKTKLEKIAKMNYALQAQLSFKNCD